MNMPFNFQSAASRQGRRFAQDCDELLESCEFVLGKSSVTISTLGIEIDRIATSPKGCEIWFEYKGSIRGDRPGLIRTDTLKKAIANGALVSTMPNHPPFVVLTSHLPTHGAGAAMLHQALTTGLLADVIRVSDLSDVARLKRM